MRKLRLLVVVLLAVALSGVGLSAASASDSRTKPPEIRNLGSVATISEHNRAVAHEMTWARSLSSHERVYAAAAGIRIKAVVEP